MKADKFTTSIVLFVAILVVINLLSEQFYLRLDFTEDKSIFFIESTKSS